MTCCHWCPSAGRSAAAGFTADLLADTRRAFQAKLGAVFASATAGLSQASAAVVAAAALYEELLPSLAVGSQHMQALVGASGGVPAADRLLSNALQSTPPEVRGVEFLKGVWSSQPQHIKVVAVDVRACLAVRPAGKAAAHSHRRRTSLHTKLSHASSCALLVLWVGQRLLTSITDALMC